MFSLFLTESSEFIANSVCPDQIPHCLSLLYDSLYKLHQQINPQLSKHVDTSFSRKQTDVAMCNLNRAHNWTWCHVLL